MSGKDLNPLDSVDDSSEESILPVQFMVEQINAASQSVAEDNPFYPIVYGNLRDTFEAVGRNDYIVAEVAWTSVLNDRMIVELLSDTTRLQTFLEICNNLITFLKIVLNSMCASIDKYQRKDIIKMIKFYKKFLKKMKLQVCTTSDSCTTYTLADLSAVITSGDTSSPVTSEDGTSSSSFDDIADACAEADTMCSAGGGELKEFGTNAGDDSW